MDLGKCVNAFFVVVILSLQIKLCLGFDKALERIKLEGHNDHDIDIFIERKIHFLHSRIDLKPTLDGILMLEKCVLRLEQGSTTSLSRTLSVHISKRVDRIVTKLARVTERDPSRHKRSIEFIGNLWSDLFGNPGPSDWKQINSNILAMKSAIGRLNDNTNIDHKDIDTNRHQIEKQSEVIRSITAVVNKSRAELTKVDDDINFMRNFFEILTLLEAVESQIDFLIEIRIDSLKGFCNDRALNKNFLVDNLLSLEANKLGLGPVFSSWEWREYYKNQMCTTALEQNDLWVTIRIPLIKKVEKLVRVIPSQDVNEIVKKFSNYGIVVSIFKEKSHEKYHAMTQSSFDLCNKLGSTRTCGVREVKFVPNAEIIIPVEFALNRILVVGNRSSIKVMSKCPTGIAEHTFTLDSVWLIPNNCSYTSNHLSIDIRESDIEITREIGIVHFDKLVVNPVSSKSQNSTLIVEEVLNSSASKTFERNRNEIKYELDLINTSHTTFLSRYSFEKWLIISSIVLISLLVILTKLYSSIKKCRSANGSNNDFELENNGKGMSFLQLQQLQSKNDFELGYDHTLTQQQQQQQQQQQLSPRHTNSSDDPKHSDGAKCAPKIIIHESKDLDERSVTSNVYAEIANAANVSFSSKPEHSQFRR